MEIINEKISLKTNGDIEIHNITSLVKSIVEKHNIKSGIVTIFIPGATGAITTMEYEPGLIKDTQEMFKKIVDEKGKYHHDVSHIKGNATSHLRASLVGPSLTVPVVDGDLYLGTWQEIVFIEFDNRPRNREIVVTILGKK
jgi:secondary thiamine-phosphate synthase enzyme